MGTSNEHPAMWLPRKDLVLPLLGQLPGLGRPDYRATLECMTRSPASGDSISRYI